MKINTYYVNEFRVEILSIVRNDAYQELISEGLMEFWNYEYAWRHFESGAEWFIELSSLTQPDEKSLSKMFDDNPDLLLEFLGEWDLARSNVDLFKEEMGSAIRIAIVKQLS